MFIKKPFWHSALSCFATASESGSTPDDAGNENPPSDDGGKNPGDAPQLNEHGYPENTPIKEMTAEQQVAYWKYHAQKHERRSKDREDYDAIKAERDRLKQSTMTDAEKQLEQAKAEGKAEAANEFSNKMVDAMIRGSLSGRGLEKDEIDTRLSFIDPKAFLTTDGEVDSDKVDAFVEASGPAGKQQQQAWPDTGGGNRGGGKGLGGSVQAGKDLYAQRRSK